MICPLLDISTYPKLILAILIYYGNSKTHNFQSEGSKGWQA